MKFNQAIEKLIENPKDVYGAICSNNSRKELLVKDGYFIFKRYGSSGELLENNRASGGFNNNVNVNDEWQLVRQSVRFMTAMNSGKNSKPIIEGTACDFREAEYWLSVTKLNLDMVNGKWLVE